MSAVLGIDLSLRATGLALMKSPTDGFLDGLHSPDVSFKAFHGATASLCLGRLNGTGLLPDDSDGDLFTFARWAYIHASIMRWASFAETIVIEGYGFGMTSDAKSLAEIGGIIRYHLIEKGLRPIVIAPATLKKFITGKGNADKSIVLKEVLRRYELDIDDHNMADAFGLALIGKAIMEGTDGLPAFQRDIIEEIKMRRTTPKTKRKGKRNG